MKELPRKIILLISLVLLTVCSFMIDWLFERSFLSRIFYSTASITVNYIVIKIILEGIFASRLKDYKMRYNTKRVLSIIFIILLIGSIITIWIENTQAILLAYGLLAAGIAIALQDFFKGFTGGILILLNNLYRVGDRIQIGDTHGDIMDIGIFYTTLLETRGWVKGDQATGRIITVPNARVLSEDIFNYTKDHSFLWDEILIPLTYDSNWESILEPVLNILKEETMKMTETASKEIDRIGEKYYLPKRDVQPMVYVDLDDSWVNIHARFVTEAKKRRGISDRINKRILRDLLKRKDVKIAQAQIESWKLGEGP